MFISYHGVLKRISDTFLCLISRHFKFNNSPSFSLHPCLCSASPLTSFPLLCCRSTPTTSWRRRLVTGETWPSQEAWPCQSSPPLSSQPSALVRNLTRPPSIMRCESLGLTAKTNRAQFVYQCPGTQGKSFFTKWKIQHVIGIYAAMFWTARSTQYILYFRDADLNCLISSVFLSLSLLRYRCAHHVGLRVRRGAHFSVSRGRLWCQPREGARCTHWLWWWRWSNHRWGPQTFPAQWRSSRILFTRFVL